MLFGFYRWYLGNNNLPYACLNNNASRAFVGCDLLHRSCNDLGRITATHHATCVRCRLHKQVCVVLVVDPGQEKILQKKKFKQTRFVFFVVVNLRRKSLQPWDTTFKAPTQIYFLLHGNISNKDWVVWSSVIAPYSSWKVLSCAHFEHCRSFLLVELENHCWSFVRIVRGWGFKIRLLEFSADDWMLYSTGDEEAGGEPVYLRNADLLT